MTISLNPNASFPDLYFLLCLEDSINQAIAILSTGGGGRKPTSAPSTTSPRQQPLPPKDHFSHHLREQSSRCHDFAAARRVPLSSFLHNNIRPVVELDACVLNGAENVSLWDEHTTAWVDGGGPVLLRVKLLEIRPLKSLSETDSVRSFFLSRGPGVRSLNDPI